MDMAIKTRFVESWNRYFSGAEFPISFYYTNAEDAAERVPIPAAHMCMIGVLAKVRKGTSLSFDVDSIGCGGDKRYTDFTQDISPTFEYFLSCSISGKLEGERYKKFPEVVKEMLKIVLQFKALRALSFSSASACLSNWTIPTLSSSLRPLTFFPAISPSPTTTKPNRTVSSVPSPQAAGRSSSIPISKSSARPKAVIGMFDVSARAYVPKETLTFAVPMNEFIRMVHNMEENFFDYAIVVEGEKEVGVKNTTVTYKMKILSWFRPLANLGSWRTGHA